MINHNLQVNKCCSCFFCREVLLNLMKIARNIQTQFLLEVLLNLMKRISFFRLYYLLHNIEAKRISFFIYPLFLFQHLAHYLSLGPLSLRSHSRFQFGITETVANTTPLIRYNLVHSSLFGLRCACGSMWLKEAKFLTSKSSVRR